MIGDIIFVGDEPRKITQEFLVRRPMRETSEDRSKRIAARMPEPTMAYTVVRTESIAPKKHAPTP
jgi:hypothetical protein